MGQFLNKDGLQVCSKDGHDFVLCEALMYLSNQGHTYRVPSGSTTDGISTPKELWAKYPPFGNWWFPGILHDAGYRDTLEIQDIEGAWHPTTLTKEMIDWLFKEAMVNNGVSEWDAEIIFQGVNQFGTMAFVEDRKKKS